MSIKLTQLMITHVVSWVKHKQRTESHQNWHRTDGIPRKRILYIYRKGTKDGASGRGFAVTSKDVENNLEENRQFVVNKQRVLQVPPFQLETEPTKSSIPVSTMVSVRSLGNARRRAVVAATHYDDALPSLSQLASQQRFDEIIEILQFQRKLEHWLCVPNPAKLTALHMVLPYHPPVALLDVLIASLGRLVEPHYIPEATVDVRGQTPLHVAASSGCDISVLKRLTKMSHMAVFHHDNLGRLPLHCLCSMDDDSVSWSSSSKRKKKRDHQNTMQCIHLLLDIHPRACLMRDIAGRTPLNLAVENRMDQSVLSALLTKMPQQQQQQQQQQQRRFRQAKSPLRSAATKSMSTWERLPLEVVRTVSADEDDVSSVGLRSFHWKPRTKPHQQYRKRNVNGPFEV